MRFAMGPLALVAWVGGSGLAARGAVNAIDTLGNIPAADYAASFAPQTYKDWGNEPYVAVNPVDPNKIVVSGFGFGTPTGQLLYSTDGGASWLDRFPITNPPGLANGSAPHDQTFAYDSAGVLHGLILAGGTAGDNVYHGTIADPNLDGFNGRGAASTWTWNATKVNSTALNTADQPNMAIRGSTVFAAYDNFDSTFNTVEERVVVSTDNGVTFSAANDQAISRGGRLVTNANPGTRVATDATGRAYAVFGVGVGGGSGLETIDYRLNQYSNGAWNYTNANTGPGGLVVADNVSSHQIGSSFGGINEPRGNQTAITADTAGSHVYAVFGKQDPNNAGIDNLFVAEFHRDGNGDLVERANPVQISTAGQWAVLPSVTVTADGTLWAEYDSFSSADGTFHVHLTRSTDFGLTFADQDIYDFTSPGSPNTSSFPDKTRMLGDYQFLTNLGNNVYGTFAARGNVNAGGINTTGNIDAFFFSVAGVPEPASLGLMAGAAALLLHGRRGRRG